MVSLRAQRLKHNGFGPSRSAAAGGGGNRAQQNALWWLPSNLIFSLMEYLQSKSFRVWLKKNIGEFSLSMFIMMGFAYLYLPSMRNFTAQFVVPMCSDKSENDDRMFSGLYKPCVSDLAFILNWSLLFVFMIYFAYVQMNSIIASYNITLAVRQKQKYAHNVVQAAFNALMSVIIILFFVKNYVKRQQNGATSPWHEVFTFKNKNGYSIFEKIAFLLQGINLSGVFIFSLLSCRGLEESLKSTNSQISYALTSVCAYVFNSKFSLIWMAFLHLKNTKISLRIVHNRTAFKPLGFAIISTELLSHVLVGIMVYIISMDYNKMKPIYQNISVEDASVLFGVVYLSLISFLQRMGYNQ